MAAYTRQSTFSDGDTISASLFNNEYELLGPLIKSVSLSVRLSSSSQLSAFVASFMD